MTNLLKIKGGDGTEGSEAAAGSGVASAETSGQSDNAAAGGSGAAPAPVPQNMQQKMSSGLDKLDSLLTKTENAQYSMAHQSKQMKSFLQ